MRMGLSSLYNVGLKFIFVQEVASFCRNVEVKGGIMMGRLITSTDSLLED